MKKRISFLAFIFAIFLSALTVSCILLIDAEPHEHTFDKTKWMSDEVCHWHAATCAHVYEEADRAEHSFDSGRITKEPTTTKTGEKIFVCSVCEYVYKEEIPVLDSDEDTPSGGGSTPSEGETPNEGDNTPNGGDTPNEGGSTPSEGGDTPSGGDTPNEGDNNTAGGEEDVDDEGVRNWNNYVANGWIVVKDGVIQPVAEENRAKIVGKLTIPNSVKEIGSLAFRECGGLTSVTMSNSITKIQSEAFNLCGKLTTIVIPDSVTEIGGWAFHQCRELTGIEIPASVIEIGISAFGYCTNFTSINVDENNPSYCSVDGVLFNKDKTVLVQYPAGKNGSYVIPNSVNKINSCAFWGCIGDIPSIEIPNTITSIDDQVFMYCEKVENIVIPSSVTAIGEMAFYGTGLKTIYIPASVVSIGKNAFGYCTNLTSVTFESYNDWYAGTTKINLSDPAQNAIYLTSTYMDSDWVHGDDISSGGNDNPSEGGNTPSGGGDNTSGGDTPSGGGDNTSGNEEDANDEGVRNWNNYVANGWIVVKNGIVQPVAEENRAKIVGKITIPNSVTKIGDSAFIFCREITSVKFPDSVTEIGHGSFFKCDSITSVEIPASVTSIECGAFADCSNLANINVNVNNSSYTSEDGILFNKDKTILMQCPASKTGSYIIPSSVKIISGNAFKGCEFLESVKIPDSVTTIEGEAFINCNSLTSIEIPDSVTTIERYSFGGCFGLTNINVDVNNPSYISEDGILFNKDKTILLKFPTGRTGSYEIPSTVIKIEEFAFDCCTGLTSVNIPNSVISIENYAFKTCGFISIEIPSSVTNIGRFTFLYCENLTSITFEDTANWYSSESEDSNQKTPIDVTNPSENATKLKDEEAWCQKWLVKNPE